MVRRRQHRRSLPRVRSDLNSQSVIGETDYVLLTPGSVLATLLSMSLKIGGSLALVKDREIERMNSIEKRNARVIRNSDPIGVMPCRGPKRRLLPNTF